MNLIQALSTLDKGRSDLGTSVLLKGEVWADFRSPSPSRFARCRRPPIRGSSHSRGPGAGAGAGAAAARRQRSQCGRAGLGSAGTPVGTRRRPRAPSPGRAEPEGAAGRREGEAWGAARCVFFSSPPFPDPPCRPPFPLLLLLGFF